MLLFAVLRILLKSGLWISGAFFHATFSTEKMKNLRTGNFGKVRSVNNQSLDIT